MSVQRPSPNRQSIPGLAPRHPPADLPTRGGDGRQARGGRPSVKVCFTQRLTPWSGFAPLISLPGSSPRLGEEECRRPPARFLFLRPLDITDHG